MLWAILGIAAIGAAVAGPLMSNVEQAKYDVVRAQAGIEVRDYAPHIVAEAEVTGERKEAINDGFRLVADYIFGNNTSSQKVAMATPVVQQPSEKIAMTTPVIQQAAGNAWKIQFIMPANYTMETLPKPNNNAVTLRQVAAKRFAVVRFSGMAGAESLKAHTETLNDFVSSQKLRPLSAPTFAFYNPPWTLPFLRRNEVMVEVAQ